MVLPPEFGRPGLSAVYGGTPNDATGWINRRTQLIVKKK
jgi:hypothetical protein